MTIRRSVAAIIALMAGFAVASCERAKQAKAAEPEPLIIHYSIGSIWDDGYSLEVSYDHLVLESARCPMAKDGHPASSQQGFCVIRISEAQWNDFVRAMRPYRSHAIPLDPKIFDREILRPDGKPCKSEATDHNMIGITWFDETGASYSGYYEGCDQQEFRRFFDQLKAAPMVLPIKELIQED